MVVAGGDSVCHAVHEERGKDPLRHGSCTRSQGVGSLASLERLWAEASPDLHSARRISARGSGREASDPTPGTTSPQPHRLFRV